MTKSELIKKWENEILLYDKILSSQIISENDITKYLGKKYATIECLNDLKKLTKIL